MSSNNPKRDYDQALQLKVSGNEAFKAGDLKLALKNYTRIFMHIGMNPCMNLSEMMNTGGSPPDLSKKPSSTKDPIQQQTDLLRLTAFNNIAAVYSKMGNWEQCKEKCTRVLKHDPKNCKALFRRGKAYRKLNLYELARSDLKKVKELVTGSTAAIDNELKQLTKDEKNASKEVHAIYKRNMRKAKRRQMNKNKKKKMRSKAKEEIKSVAVDDQIVENDDGIVQHLMKNDLDENLNQNTKDSEYVWDLPLNKKDSNTNGNCNEVTDITVIDKKMKENAKRISETEKENASVEDGDGQGKQQSVINITNDDIQPTMF